MATILCVEDEDHIREDMAELMEKAGHKALQACDGKVALEMILEHKPDLVVSDITMPVMDGRALLMRLRENHPAFADLPFIFLSALADKERVLAGLTTGADAYLTKPINYEILLSTVQASLRQMARIKQKHEDVVMLDM